MDQFDKQNNGTTITARRLADALSAAGHTVTVLAGGNPEPGKICAKKHISPFFQKLIESQGMCFAKPDPALYYEAFKDADIVHFFLPFRFRERKDTPAGACPAWRLFTVSRSLACLFNKIVCQPPALRRFYRQFYTLWLSMSRAILYRSN